MSRLTRTVVILAVVAAGSATGTPASAAIPPSCTGIVKTGVFAWGTNDVGQLGLGSYGGTHLSPAQTVGTDSNMRAVSAGWSSSAAITNCGTVATWGDNGWGQLGTDYPNYHNTPVLIPGLANIVQVSVGYQHVLALDSAGTVWAWGGNPFGELGIGGTSPQFVPFPTKVHGLSDVVAISAGRHFSVALTSDGTVWTWGSDIGGTLGDGGNSGIRTLPFAVPGLTGVTQIAATEFAAMALRTDGSVWAWGLNGSGQLGDGTLNEHDSPHVTLPFGKVTQIAVGPGNGYALRTDGTVWTWGDNDHQQLARPAGTYSPTPGPVAGFGGVTQIAAGISFVEALRSDGTVWGWGENDHGELGVGTTQAFYAVPWPIPAFTGATMIAAGINYAMALRAFVPDFTVALSPITGTVHGGGVLTTQVQLTGLNGFTGTANLTATGLPAGTTATFSPATTSPGAPSTLTLGTSLGTPAGTYPITITATAPAKPPRTATFTLTVGTPADFTISLSEEFGSVDGGAATSTLVELNPIDGYAGTITVTAGTKSLPTGMAISISPATAGVSTPATMTVSTTFDTPEGTYLITVIGQANDPLVRPIRTTTYQLTVGPPIG